MNSDRDQTWYVVQSRPRQERRALANLHRQQFCAFLPTMAKTIRRGRSFEDRIVPLFPGYLFVAFDADRDSWRSIFGTFGVARLICAGDTPIALPRGLVEQLTAGMDRVADNALRSGDRVQIVRGPFAGFVAQLVQLGSAGRVRVLLSVLGGDVPLDLKSSVLGAAA